VNFSAHPLTLLLQRTAAPQSSHRTRAKVSAPSIDDGGEDWQRRRRQCWSIGKRQAWRSPPAELHACHYFRQLSHACCHTQVLHYAALTTAAKTGNGGGDHTSHLTPHTSHLTPVAAPLSKLRRGAGFEWGHRREPGGHLKQSSEGSCQASSLCRLHQAFKEKCSARTWRQRCHSSTHCCTFTETKYSWDREWTRGRAGGARKQARRWASQTPQHRSAR
jgi:hypothetical protein